MNANNASNMARDAVPAMKKASDDVMSSAGKAIDSTREHANQALDMAENKVRELRGNVDPVVEMLASKAQKMARQSLDMASEAKERAENSLTHAADNPSLYLTAAYALGSDRCCGWCGSRIVGFYFSPTQQQPLLKLLSPRPPPTDAPLIFIYAPSTFFDDRSKT